jgi:hypothetical protein
MASAWQDMYLYSKPEFPSEIPHKLSLYVSAPDTKRHMRQTAMSRANSFIHHAVLEVWKVNRPEGPGSLPQGNTDTRFTVNL